MSSNTFQKYSYSNTLVNDAFVFIFVNLESIHIQILFKVFVPGLVLSTVERISFQEDICNLYFVIWYVLVLTIHI